LGFSQGGSVCIDLALHYDFSFAGVVSVCAGVLEERMQKNGAGYCSVAEKNVRTPPTPVLCIWGGKDELYTEGMHSRTAEYIEARFVKSAKYIGKKFPLKKHGMISSEVNSIFWLCWT
jgi:predicted esterase